MIPAGSHVAKLVNYGVGKTNAGLPQIILTFGVTTDQGAETINWYGTLKEGRGREITIESLLRCGLEGNSLAAIADGPDGGALDMSQEVLLVVEETEKENGKKVATVKWVNSLGMVNTLSAQEAKALMMGGFEGDVMAARQKTGIKQPDPNAKERKTKPDHPNAPGGENSNAPVKGQDGLDW